MEKENFNFTSVLLFVVIFAALFTIILKQGNNGGRELDEGLPIGSEALPYQVSEWINGKGPDFEDLKGKVYVLNAWGLNCVYCRKFAPVLVKAHKMYKDKGVEFIGMTGNPNTFRKDLEHHLVDMNMTWPNGIEAEQFMRDYQVRGIPNAWVVDKTGKIVWKFGSRTPLEDAIGKALAAK
jgi:thiol-disulfide isomerase/thioredoxin